MSKKTWGFVVTAIIALVTHFALFKMRYGWYTTDEASAFLSIGYAICLLGVALLWAFYPSRVGVALFGIVALVFPFLVRPEIFVRPDLGFAAFATVPIALLIAATYFRWSKGN